MSLDETGQIALSYLTAGAALGAALCFAAAHLIPLLN